MAAPAIQQKCSNTPGSTNATYPLNTDYSIHLAFGVRRTDGGYRSRSVAHPSAAVGTISATIGGRNSDEVMEF